MALREIEGLRVNAEQPRPLVRQAHHPEQRRGTGRGVEGLRFLQRPAIFLGCGAIHSRGFLASIDD